MQMKTCSNMPWKSQLPNRRGLNFSALPRMIQDRAKLIESCPVLP